MKNNDLYVKILLQKCQTVIMEKLLLETQYKIVRTLVKSVYQKINFLISQPKHMLWVLKRTVSMRRFF